MRIIFLPTETTESNKKHRQTSITYIFLWYFINIKSCICFTIMRSYFRSYVFIILDLPTIELFVIRSLSLTHIPLHAFNNFLLWTKKWYTLYCHQNISIYSQFWDLYGLIPSRLMYSIYVQTQKYTDVTFISNKVSKWAFISMWIFIRYRYSFNIYFIYVNCLFTFLKLILINTITTKTQDFFTHFILCKKIFFIFFHISISVPSICFCHLFFLFRYVSVLISCFFSQNFLDIFVIFSKFSFSTTVIAPIFFYFYNNLFIFNW